ncbi:lipopolysaccharide assembly protein LapB [Algoriphagus sp. A40]|uniref:type IX secretion system periplasmic lipoprotein PorW/SprE n=1 Tax=Algoriphagus sp. A40 TaxID=1945863 RepID=UPI000984A118|nr:gliding motility protein [Algoriphagus sp. A40]OOG69327.1 gliding motility protein [Algoriphagus sp. A40]
MKKFSGLAVVLFIIIGACSSEKNTFTNRTFHNLTSHFNAYYLADAKIKEVENQVLTNYKEDFTQILPVFIPIDSGTVKTYKAKLDSAHELSSKAIDWHRISKWVDDSYYLLGKIDYLQGQQDDALNAFKYVNSNSKDKELRHKSLISLLRLYVDKREYENANFTIDYLSKETEISDENRFALFRTLAYYYETRIDQNGVIGALDRAVEYAPDKKEESRINFILAQRYQKEGLDALAYDYYRKSLDGNPPYERSFFATLYAQQVAELNASKDLKKVRNYYEELYKDPKNKDLKDVVIYERALFEEKQGDIPLTIDLLHQAAKEPGSNPRLKGYIYQKLAAINFEEFKDFRASKYYLDSALTFIKADDPVAIEIQDQKATLDQYVFHVERIQLNDSLKTIAGLSTKEQTALAERFILAEQERLIQEAQAKDQPKNSNIFNNLLAFSGKDPGASFYFDNGAAMQQGVIEFNRTWGNRPLQDNWRRRAAIFQTTTQPDLMPINTDSLAPAENPILAGLPTLESLLDKIPNNPEQLALINGELEESYFELGKLLYFDLKEIEPSIDNLETLIRDFPNTARKPEAYYLLYLGQKDSGGNFEQYVGRLNREFPESQYTFSVNNPDAASGNLAALESSKGYEEAYNAYYSGQYQKARQVVKSTLEEYPLTRNTEKLLLLDIMVTGKLESRDRFKSRLESYIENTKDQALVSLARNMLRPLLSSEELAAMAPKDSVAVDSSQLLANLEAENQAKEIPADSPYKLNESQTHIFVIALTRTEAEVAKNLLGDLENYHASAFPNARLRTGNMNMSPENAIYIISPFANAEKAKAYYEKFSKEFKSDGFPEEARNNSFFISIENFQTLNKSKNLEEYRTFFRTIYQ